MPENAIKAPRAVLINHTPLPKETIWALWDASKTDNPSRTPQWVKENVPADEVDELFWKVVAQNIPVGEMVYFLWQLENVSISYREQMVRHRIGVKVGENFGTDIVPGFNDSSWWSQSMRIKDVGDFAEQQAHRMPETIASNPAAAEVFLQAMELSAAAYRTLTGLGVPLEDARDVVPQAATHRISWSLNLQAMIHILAKRGCWILQASLWHPIINTMIEALCEQVDPGFRRLTYPPCIGPDGRFKDCTFKHENERRMDGRDALPPCPLYLTQHLGMDPRARLPGGPPAYDVPMREAVIERSASYGKLWGRDPYTWEK